MIFSSACACLLSIGQSDLFAAAYFNDLTMLNVYVEGLGDDMTRLAECSEVGNTALHLALQRDNEDVALHLMKLHPPLINITYEGILYQGEALVLPEDCLLVVKYELSPRKTMLPTE